MKNLVIQTSQTTQQEQQQNSGNATPKSAKGHGHRYIRPSQSPSGTFSQSPNSPQTPRQRRRFISPSAQVPDQTNNNQSQSEPIQSSVQQNTAVPQLSQDSTQFEFLDPPLDPNKVPGQIGSMQNSENIKPVIVIGRRNIYSSNSSSSPVGSQVHSDLQRKISPSSAQVHPQSDNNQSQSEPIQSFVLQNVDLPQLTQISTQLEFKKTSHGNNSPTFIINTQISQQNSSHITVTSTISQSPVIASPGLILNNNNQNLKERPQREMSPVPFRNPNEFNQSPSEIIKQEIQFQNQSSSDKIQSFPQLFPPQNIQNNHSSLHPSGAINQRHTNRNSRSNSPAVQSKLSIIENTLDQEGQLIQDLLKQPEISRNNDNKDSPLKFQQQSRENQSSDLNSSSPVQTSSTQKSQQVFHNNIYPVPEGVTAQDIKDLEDRHIICCLDHLTMNNPVKARDGKFYEIDTVTPYLLGNNLMLPDGTKAELTDLIVNVDDRKAIEDFVEKNPNHLLIRK
ncbi:MAG: hypothetical protein EZS28_024781 [Streblomastix strix]|uniref:U-box domain-containing protein n=1 Tax=Streblomastix strix TaxID=222440 RepID=A0A5J4VB98_9EUKA|nr:MAG: hypothetical protein EZS28_024781 [Streblomastix strix]